MVVTIPTEIPVLVPTDAAPVTTNSRTTGMHQATITVLIGVASAVLTGWTSLNAIQNGYYRASRRYGRRRIYRSEHPTLFWVNVVLLLAFCALGLILAGWALVSPGSFH